MDVLSTYLPQDRRQALARGELLPDHTRGAALFADISGFTPLTETLTQLFGARRGAEELTLHLNQVYDALIAQVDNYGGSVLSFAGDGITCWFDETEAPHRALACGLALQTAMEQFAMIPLSPHASITLALKVAVASGSARRFLVGDPTIQYLDALAGDTIVRMAAAEHLAQRGEVLVDAFAAETLAEFLEIIEWRADPETHERFAVIRASRTRPSLSSTRDLPLLPIDQLRPWILPAVYERERTGQGAFLAEFRPVVALFLRFVGLNYEDAEAGQQLDRFIQRVQVALAHYAGALLQLTIGDKGSYLYAAFGALTAHEDDARRAVKAALELGNVATELGFRIPLQIGISQGVMWAGAYGGQTRRTYGVLGDEVNLAARLMQTAEPGEILLSGRVQQTVASAFTFEPRPPLLVKGKAEPLPVFAVTGAREHRAVRLQEPTYALPMVGRQTDVHLITEKMDLTLQGQGQVVGIVAEAGMGKSRLVAEVIRIARRKGFVGYGGACQSDGVNTPYQAWKPIWSAFFDVDPTMPQRKLLRNLESEIEDRAPARVNALPLLGAVLDLAIPDNTFTQSLEPKDRKGALHALLEDCLRAAAREEPLLLVIEDLHWLDALSHDLLEDLARATTTSRLCIVLAYRPPQLARLADARLEALSNFTKIELTELSPAECDQAIHAKLAQLYPARGGSVPPLLVERLIARAQGNPFYLEELLNYLHDRGLDPHDPGALHQIEWPESLHALILSRIDQLSEREKTTLRVASIVGRLFRSAWLTGYYPALGSLSQVKADLDKLQELDITPLDTPEPELAYLFKHIVTHEVAYASLPYDTRARLHVQLAQYLETTYPGASWLDTLAHHYGQSANHAKQREYFQKAGNAAQANFANESALDYYARLSPLLTDPVEQVELHLRWGAVLEHIGRWEEAETHYREALNQAAPDTARTARCQFALGKLCCQRGDYPASLAWLAQVRTAWEGLKNNVGLGQALIETGQVYWRIGEYMVARQYAEDGLRLAQEAGDLSSVSWALNNLGLAAYSQGDYAVAQALHEESLALRRETSNTWGVANSLNNLGHIAWNQGNYRRARTLYEESLMLRREMGDKLGTANALGNLGMVAGDQGDYPAALALQTESLALAREMGDKPGISASLNNLGFVAFSQGDYATARRLHEESLVLRQEMGDKLGIATSLTNLGEVALIQSEYTAARALYEESMALSREIGDKTGIAIALNSLGLVADSQNDYALAWKLLTESLELMCELGDKRGIVDNLSGMAGVACHVGANARAARLAAASEILRADAQFTRDPIRSRRYDDVTASLQFELGEVAFNAAWAEGQAMTLEQVIVYAREEALD